MASGARRPSSLPSSADRPPVLTEESSSSSAKDAFIHPFLRSETEGFSLDYGDVAYVTPTCLKNSGIELIAIDPGHDDTPSSRRSDALVRGQENRGVQFLWPKVHEGNLNQVVSWLAYEYMVNHPRLSFSERTELSTMIRFSRYPGEKTFGQYEKEFGYSTKTQGTIDFSVTNRKDRVNFMMKNHRTFDAQARHFWSAQTKDVTSNTLFVSVHADSSEYFNEGDHSWIIPPQDLGPESENKILQSFFVKGFSYGFGNYFQWDREDSSEIKNLKLDLQGTVQEESIKTQEHRLDLAMLSKSVGNSDTLKFLTEGFVMNGKAGNLANKDMTSLQPMFLSFKRGTRHIKSYDYARLYGAYAKSIVKSITGAYGCSSSN